MNFSANDLGGSLYHGLRLGARRLSPDFHPTRLFPDVAGRLRQALRVEEYAIDGGHKLYLTERDYVSRQLQKDQIWEPVTTHMVNEFARPGTAAIDVGAHIGYYSLLLARNVGPEGKVYAFEPHQGNFRLLERNVKLNGYRNIQTERYAVGNDRGLTDLYVCEQDQGDHSLQARSEGRKTQRVPIVRLDDYFEGRKMPVSLIKVDVQGGEVNAMRGMPRLLEKNPEAVVIVEYEPPNFKRAERQPRDLIQPFLNRGYVLHEIDEVRKVVEPTTIADLARKYPEDCIKDTNLLFARSEQYFLLPPRIGLR